MTASKIFFITGVSSGFGKALASVALEAGHKVIGTVRNEKALLDFEALASDKAVGRVLDVINFEAAERIASEVENAIGPVDIVINNAGYGHEGILEESPLEAMRHQFDVNVFGAVAVTKGFIPF